MKDHDHCFVKRCTKRIEFTKAKVASLSANIRGVYLLLQKTGRDDYETRYVGMSTGGKKGIKGRLEQHLKSKTKSTVCTHFEIYEFHKTIKNHDIRDLEGLLRHAYRKSMLSNSLNKSRSSKTLYRLRV